MISESNIDIFKLWLCSINGFNGSTAFKLLSHFGSALEVYEASEKKITELLPPHAAKAFFSQRALQIPSALLYEMQKKDIKVTFFGDEDYPNRLSCIPDPPAALFYIGNLPNNNTPSVAIIGARDCSDYGAYEAQEIGSYLGRSGVSVISGMARGIDGIAQNASLSSGGKSFGVLGSGPDICYPTSNKFLYQKLIAEGGVISLYPPGEPAKPFNFPPRNRIVSGLSDAIIVIEARQKSGTIITVDTALEQGREVYALPGRICDRLSDGCNGLIGQGASIFLSPEIFLSELLDSLNNLPNDKHSNHRNFDGSAPASLNLNEEQKEVYNCLEITPTQVNDLCEKIPQMDYNQILMILMQLVIDGHAVQTAQGFFSRRH